MFIGTVIIVLVMNVIGFTSLGIEKMDFMKDFVQGWQTNELVALLMAGAVGFVGSLLVKLINSEKYGYLR